MIQSKSLLCQAMMAFLAFFLLDSCNVISQNRVNGNGHVIKEDRQVPAFHRLKVEGSMDVYLSQGPAKAAVIEAEDNITPLIEILEEDGRLIVRQKRNTSISTHKDIIVYLTTPDVDDISLSGSGDVKLTDKFNAKDDLKLRLSGSGNIKGEINAPHVKADIAGSGNMELKGETKDVNLSIAGSGNFEAEDLLAENVTVSIAGSGDADVHASVKLDAKIMGSGDVKYKGTPQISSSVMGSGSVQKK
ncbi:putative autotransporter adhesin-like protein [Chitinophaga niastensis]|uniref:Putative autotransporter adhesin-like protein n=1 Tax=Chitinophaga niastensis TaxID=536980 RepID=A0A2P8HVH2_CHINA|nr:head GIN domain-containing protein [Chitinophaga niastensis]PSL50227.1 putative autotransporter adhesin-like protein [Chitinophaga niastensis]